MNSSEAKIINATKIGGNHGTGERRGEAPLNKRADHKHALSDAGPPQSSPLLPLLPKLKENYAANGFQAQGHSNWTICSLILFLNFPAFLSFILGAPFSYYCRERKEGRKEQGLKMGKRESLKSE